jgi:hypothetical protein
MTEAIIAAIATVFAGFGLKFFDWLVNRKTEKRILEEKARETISKASEADIADRKAQILELRQEMIDLRRIIDEKEDEMLQWREKYWALREDQVNTLVSLDTALKRIKELTGNGNGKNSG